MASVYILGAYVDFNFFLFLRGWGLTLQRVSMPNHFITLVVTVGMGSVHLVLPSEQSYFRGPFCCSESFLNMTSLFIISTRK